MDFKLKPNFKSKLNMSKVILFILLLISSGLSALLPPDQLSPNATVALDGSGNCRTISEAIAGAPDRFLERYVIHIKRGVYKEYVDVPENKWNLVLLGDGIDVSIISGSRSNSSGWKTLYSATFSVTGQGFIARDLTFENTAGPENGQAVAFRSQSDRSALFRCAFRGFQGTLYAHSKRQFFRECIITGTVDFIFGDATAVFQNCTILARQGLPGQENTITAQGRATTSETTGFVIQFCSISTEPGVASTTETYLGRPWKLYSRTVVMQSYLSMAVRPQGWLEWNGSFGLDTLYYGEYQNRGPGAVLDGRVRWIGFHVITNEDVASTYTVAQFLEGNHEWLHLTGVTYTPGLVPA